MSLGNLPNARVYICSEDYSPSPLPWPHFLGKKLRMQAGRKQDSRASPRCEQDSTHLPAFTASPTTSFTASLLTPRLLLVPCAEMPWNPSSLLPQHQQMFNRLALVAFPSSGYLIVHPLPCPVHRTCWDAIVHSSMNWASSALLHHEPNWPDPGWLPGHLLY